MAKNRWTRRPREIESFSASNNMTSSYRARVIFTPWLQRTSFSLQGISQADLVFDFPGVRHAGVTCDAGMTTFSRRDVIELCFPHSSRPRYQDLVNHSECQSTFLALKGRSETQAFDRPNMAKYMAFSNTIKPRGLAAASNRVNCIPVPFFQLFGADLRDLFDMCDRVATQWQAAVQKGQPPNSFVAFFFQDSFRPCLQVFEPKPVLGKRVRCVTPTVNAVCGSSDAKEQQQQQPEDREDDEDDDTVVIYPGGTEAKENLNWSSFLQTLSMKIPGPDSKQRDLQELLQRLDCCSSTGIPDEPFLPVQPLCDELKLNAHEVCDRLLKLGYYAWYFNAVQPSELSVYGISSRVLPKRAFQLDYRAAAKVKARAPLPPPRPVPILTALEDSRSSTAAHHASPDSVASESSRSSSDGSFMQLLQGNGFLDDFSQLSQRILGKNARKAHVAPHKRVCAAATQ